MIGIIVAFPRIENAQMIKSLLVRSGFKIISICTTGAQVMSAVDGLNDGIIVCGYKFPDMMYNELKEELPDSFDMMLVAGRANLQEAYGQGIVCVEMPVKAGDLVDTLEMLLEAAERRKRRRKSVPRSRSREEQDAIDRAKAVLMERNSMTEEDAHRYLQRISMESGTGIVETAQMVLLTGRQGM